MNRFIKVSAAFALLCAAGVLHTPAQSTNTNTVTITSHTNLLLNASISLTAYEQEVTVLGTNDLLSSETQKIASKDFVSALIAGFTNANELAGAKLMLRWKDVNLTNSTYDFILKQGTNEVSLDFSSAHPSSYLRLSAGENDIVTKRGGGNASTNVTEILILNYEFSTTKGSGTVSGFSKIRSSSLFSGRQVINLSPQFQSVSSAVSGDGFVGGHPAILKGTVTIGGRKLEVVEGP